MSTLIFYASQHGCTEKTANILKSKLKDDVTMINLKKNKRPDLTAFDTIIIGGSIHAGKMQSNLRKYIQKNLDPLLKKKLGLFLCCMEEGENAQRQFDEAFPEELRNHASAQGLFGGEFDFDKMNFFEKAIVKKVAKVTAPVSNIKEENIHQFAAHLNGLR
jgi:menaquinone-dependent protoporphyrinogen oxidase